MQTQGRTRARGLGCSQALLASSLFPLPTPDPPGPWVKHSSGNSEVLRDDFDGDPASDLYPGGLPYRTGTPWASPGLPFSSRASGMAGLAPGRCSGSAPASLWEPTWPGLMLSHACPPPGQFHTTLHGIQAVRRPASEGASHHGQASPAQHTRPWTETCKYLSPII